MNSLRLLSRLVNINPTSSILIKQSKNILDIYKLKFCPLPQSFSMATTPVYQDEKFVFRQLFDRDSCTYTYLIADPESREAVLIDPVFDLADRDSQLVKDLDLNLTHVINTHCHADHITGTGLLKKMMGRGVSSAISAAAGAIADKFLEPDQIVNIGALQLEVRPTPGHTSGCVSYVFHAGRRVFTGDTLLIRGCGRTDFQEGDSETLYHSVHDKLFQLPDDYLVFPAHDYKGVLCSTIGEEKKFNPRLTKDLEEFKLIMSNLNLPYPKMMDRSVPANKVCGLFSLPPEFEQKLQEVIAQAQANAN